MISNLNFKTIGLIDNIYKVVPLLITEAFTINFNLCNGKP